MSNGTYINSNDGELEFDNRDSGKFIKLEPIEPEAFEYNWETDKVRSLYKQLIKLGVETKIARLIRNQLKNAHIGLAYDNYCSWVWIYNTDTGNKHRANDIIRNYFIWLGLLRCNELDKIDGIELIRELFIRAYILQRFQFTGVEAPISLEV